MESKYKERAEKLLEYVTLMDCISDEEKDVILQKMCQLAEEVARETRRKTIGMDAWSTREVEELLQKQRELCAENADTKTSYSSGATQGITIIDKASILNAKLKID